MLFKSKTRKLKSDKKLGKFIDSEKILWRRRERCLKFDCKITNNFKTTISTPKT